MNCSTCEFAAKIKDAEHSGVRFEDTPCATCELTEDSSHTMAFDEERAAPVEVGGHGSAALTAGMPEIGDPDDGPDALPLSVLAEALRGFLELPPRTFRIVQRRYKGDSYALIAEELKVTPQAVEIQLRRALEAHPHLKQLLPEKAKRQAARQRRQRSMARRGKPGSV
jgi:hypothetical protein